MDDGAVFGYVDPQLHSQTTAYDVHFSGAYANAATAQPDDRWFTRPSNGRRVSGTLHDDLNGGVSSPDDFMSSFLDDQDPENDYLEAMDARPDHH